MVAIVARTRPVFPSSFFVVFGSTVLLVLHFGLRNDVVNRHDLHFPAFEIRIGFPAAVSARIVLENHTIGLLESAGLGKAISHRLPRVHRDHDESVAKNRLRPDNL